MAEETVLATEVPTKEGRIYTLQVLFVAYPLNLTSDIEFLERIMYCLGEVKILSCQHQDLNLIGPAKKGKSVTRLHFMSKTRIWISKGDNHICIFLILCSILDFNMKRHENILRNHSTSALIAADTSKTEEILLKHSSPYH